MSYHVKVFKEEILHWLKQAYGAAQFGPSTWVPMHSGGTSVVPHCRPYGTTKTLEKEGPKNGNKKTKVKFIKYHVKLDCAPNSRKPDSKTNVVDVFVLSSGAEPLAPPAAAAVYKALADKVNAM